MHLSGPREADSAPGTFARQRAPALIWIAIGLLACLGFALSLLSPFNVDEIEHVHAAWYVRHGYVPYVDFFEHHHPLLWYLLAPLFRLTGENSSVMIAGRLAMLPVQWAIAWSTYALARQATGSRQTALLALVFLLSSTAYVMSSVEIRPDVPELLFTVLALHFLLIAFDTGSLRRAALAGLAAGLSFVFLQKALVILPGLALIAARRFLGRTVSPRLTVAFANGFVAACIPGLVYLIATGAFRDYLACNWEFNRLIVGRYPTGDAAAAIGPDSAFWLVTLVSCAVFCVRRYTSNQKLGDVATVTLVLLAVLFVAGRPRRSYLMTAVPFAAVAAAAGFTAMATRLKLNPSAQVAIGGLLVLLPLWTLAARFSESNEGQLARINYVLERTSRSDFVYDGANLFNIVRRDLHYLWFTLDRVRLVDTMNEVTGGRYDNYDICALIKTRRPKVISHYQLDLAACGLEKSYQRTPFYSVYLRSDSVGN